MAANDYDDDFEDEGRPDPLAALPAAARKHYRKLEKDHASLLERLDKAEKAERKRTVESVIKSKGLPEKVASLYTGDDASEEAVATWLESFSDVFGLSSQQEAPAGEGHQEASAPMSTVEQRFQALQRAAQQTTSQATSVSDDAARQSAVENAKTPEEVLAALGG